MLGAELCGLVVLVAWPPEDDLLAVRSLRGLFVFDHALDVPLVLAGGVEMEPPDGVDHIERLAEGERYPARASDNQNVIGDLFRLHQAEFDLVPRQPRYHLIAVAIF